LVGKGEHNGEDGEDKGKDKEKSSGRNCPVVTMVSRSFRTARMALSVAVTMR
jgi:hypothetical protein